MTFQNATCLGRKKLYFKQHKFGFPGVFVIPYVKYMGDDENPWNITPQTNYNAYVIVQSELGNPIIIHGETYTGKTCLIDSVKKAVEERSKYLNTEYWVQKIDLRRLAIFWSVSGKRPTTFIQMCADYLKIDEAVVQKLFQPVTISGERIKRFVLQGDLFLDGFDQMPTPERDHFLHLLPEIMTQKREDSPIRIWITCRNYAKSTLIGVTGNVHSFEVQPLPEVTRLEFLVNYWKLILEPELDPEGRDVDCKMKSLAASFIIQFAADIDDMDETRNILSNPLFLTVCAHEVVPVVNYYLNPSLYQSNIFAFPTTNIAEVLEALILSMVEGYCMKLWDGFDKQVLHQEFKNILLIHSEFAIRTYPNYWCPSNWNFLEELDVPLNVLLCMGFLIEKDDYITFHSKVLGDAMIALLYSFPDSIKINKPFSDEFLIEHVFYDYEAKLIRKLLDISLSDISDEDCGLIKWVVVPKYLKNRYKLGLEFTSEWAKIYDKGNIWHFLILEGYHKIAQAIINSIAGTYELKCFLSMTICVTNGSPTTDDKPNHILSSLSLLALFGHGYELQEVLKTFLTVFCLEGLKKEFCRPKTWTPLHYAAMHANYWFVCYAVEMGLVQPGVHVYNPDGQLPIHCLLNNSMCHSWTLKQEVKDGHKYADTDDKESSGHILSDQLYPNQLQSQVMDGESMIRRKGMLDNVDELRLKCLRMFVNTLGANVYAPDKDGLTPLHIAAKFGYTSVIKCLVEEYRVKPKRCLDKRGRSPLHYAAENGPRENYVYLSSRGCYKNLKDNNGNTPANLFQKSYQSSLLHAGFTAKFGSPTTQPASSFFVMNPLNE